MAQQKKKKNRPPRSPLQRAGRVLYATLVVLSAIVVVLYALYASVVRPPEVSKPTPGPTVSFPPPTDNPDTDEDESLVTPAPQGLVRKDDCHTFLLMGEDNGNGNADTIMVVTYDIGNGKVGVVSVPRDTLVDVNRKIKKINAAFGAGGVEQVKEEVSTLLGIPIDHTIKINLKAFQAIVDAVGGIDFYVPQDMYHNDGAGFVINLKQGQQHLDGHHALQLVRYRGYPNADIGRTQVQRDFLTAMAKKVLSLSSLTKINQFLDIFSQYVKTDLTLGNLAYFAQEALRLDPASGVSTSVLPGDGLVSYKGIDYYYELYPEETLSIVNDLLNPYTTPMTLDDMHIFQVP